MSALLFTVPGPPVPCARARVMRGYSYTPPRTREYEKRVETCARVAMMAARWRPVDGATYELRLEVHRAARRGDWDNYAKGIADGLTKAGVWRDDRFVELALVKLFVDRTNPRALVEVVEVA